MALNKVFMLLGLAASALAMPQVVPPVATSITTVYVYSTYTRTVWTSTTDSTQLVACVQTQYALAPAAPVATSPVVTSARRKRQAPSTTSSPAAPATPTATTVYTYTQTIYAIATLTEATPSTRTRYACATTLVDVIAYVTSTIPYTQTHYANTATYVVSVPCPNAPFSALATEVAQAPTPAIPTQDAEPLPAVPTAEAVAESIFKRQTSSAATPLVATSLTQTVTLTRAAYTLVQYTTNGTTTALSYACSTTSYDATVTYVLTRTAYSATVTQTSYVSCPGVGVRDEVNDDSLDKRQTSTSAPAVPAPVATHYTKYTIDTTTITATNPATRTVYSCSTAPASLPLVPTTTATAPM